MRDFEEPIYQFVYLWILGRNETKAPHKLFGYSYGMYACV